jgi:hypothetical protein
MKIVQLTGPYYFNAQNNKAETYKLISAEIRWVLVVKQKSSEVVVPDFALIQLWIGFKKF